MSNVLTPEQLAELRSVDSPTVANASGVTTIPLEIADRLYTECLKVRERETALRDLGTSRDFTLEALRQRLLGR